MSADEPRIAKYGMPTSESQRFHANHFVVTQERAQIHDAHVAHALRVGPSLRAALDALAGKGAAPAPVVQEVPVAPEPVTPPARLPRVARPGSPDGLRERLGLR